MKYNRLTYLLVLVCVFSALNIEITQKSTINQKDYPRIFFNSGDVIQKPTLGVILDESAEGQIVQIPIGGTLVTKHSVELYDGPFLPDGYGNFMGKPTKVDPKICIVVTFREVIRNDPMWLALIAAQRRRIMLNYPPVSSPWHLPAGIAQLTSLLRADGHEVIQHYGHIEGLEYVLREYGGGVINRALSIIRNSSSNIKELYDARMILERVSAGIETEDKFVVARNNVNFVSNYYDGTVERALGALEDREQHLWYAYFMKVEVPRALDFGPDIYGISITDERQLIQGLVLGSLVKDALPSCLVVFGGNFWARVTGAFRIPKFARIFDFCDGIVYKEGFQPLQQLAATLDPRNASGTVWKEGGDVIVNPATKRPTEFELLPTPHFDGGVSQWSPDIVPSLFTMSNCPSSCGFCATPAGSDTYLKRPRSMSPRRIAEHMAALRFRRFEICDENFSIRRQLRLGQEMKSVGCEAEWECYLTADNSLLKMETCEKLYEAGCRSVQLGLESLSPETLRRENKSWNTPDNYGKILANLRAAGIQTHIFLIVGIPGEPLHWGLRWVDFLERHGENILTVKSGRYRVPRLCPEEIRGTHSQIIEVQSNDKFLHPNRDFRYLTVSRKKVEAMRDILEQACRRHWAYAVTSTIPWWVNRGRFSWEDLEKMAGDLPPEPDVRHLDIALTKVNTIVSEELRQGVRFDNFDDLLLFSHTLT